MGAPKNAAVSDPNPQDAVRADEPAPAGKTDASASALVDNIFRKLSEEEKEQAARASSYRYLVASISSAEGGREDERDKHAKATIERYVAVEQKLGKHKSSPLDMEEAATSKLLKTLVYREEKGVDDIRLCFDEDRLTDDGGGAHSAIRRGLEERYANNASFIRGYTKDGRALFQNLPSRDLAWENEYYIKGNIYMMERALACTERRTDGEKGKIVVFYDYSGYSMKNTPPAMLVKELLTDLRDHWPERLQHTFLVDAPFAFRVFWAIIKHFVDPITKEQVQFVTGEEQKEIFREMIGEDQAAPYMFEGGKDVGEVDTKAFFYDTPFDHAYGEERN